MITISIKETKKCPGFYSLFIQCKYNETIITLLKSCDFYYFDAKTKLWEIDLKSLPKILDQLTIFDDIQLISQAQSNIIQLNDALQVNENSFKTKPFPYQLDGINYGINHDSWLLLDAPGLGKTLQIIYIAETLKRFKQLEHCLIICGINTLKYNWKKEILKHSNLDCMILGERINSKGKQVIDGVEYRLKQLQNPINEFFIITNIETLRNDKIVKAINSGKNKIDMIVIDEIHACKSPTSISGKNLLKLTKAKYRIGLTGTLIMNSPIDSYVIIFMNILKHRENLGITH